jgi:hypothetical protein
MMANANNWKGKLKQRIRRKWGERDAKININLRRRRRTVVGPTPRPLPLTAKGTEKLRTKLLLLLADCGQNGVNQMQNVDDWVRV